MGAFRGHITRKTHSLASLDVFNSAAVHPDAEKMTFGNLRSADRAHGLEMTVG